MKDSDHFTADTVVADSATSLRPMRDTDLAAVIAIENHVYGFPWTEGIFRDCLRVGYTCRVVEQDTRLIAYGVMMVAVGEAHILNLCVHPRCRRLGHGSSLLMHMIETADALSASAMFLEVRPSNLAALRLYDSLGFNEVGTRKNYYPSRHGCEDALILALELSKRTRAG